MGNNNSTAGNKQDDAAIDAVTLTPDQGEQVNVSANSIKGDSGQVTDTIKDNKQEKKKDTPSGTEEEISQKPDFETYKSADGASCSSEWGDVGSAQKRWETGEDEEAITTSGNYLLDGLDIFEDALSYFPQISSITFEDSGDKPVGELPDPNSFLGASETGDGTNIFQRVEEKLEYQSYDYPQEISEKGDVSTGLQVPLPVNITKESEVCFTEDIPETSEARSPETNAVLSPLSVVTPSSVSESQVSRAKNIYLDDMGLEDGHSFLLPCKKTDKDSPLSVNGQTSDNKDLGATTNAADLEKDILQTAARVTHALDLTHQLPGEVAPNITIPHQGSEERAQITILKSEDISTLLGQGQKGESVSGEIIEQVHELKIPLTDNEDHFLSCTKTGGKQNEKHEAEAFMSSEPQLIDETKLISSENRVEEQNLEGMCNREADFVKSDVMVSLECHLQEPAMQDQSGPQLTDASDQVSSKSIIVEENQDGCFNRGASFLKAEVTASLENHSQELVMQEQSLVTRNTEPTEILPMVQNEEMEYNTSMHIPCLETEGLSKKLDSLFSSETVNEQFITVGTLYTDYPHTAHRDSCKEITGDSVLHERIQSVPDRLENTLRPQIPDMKHFSDVVVCEEIPPDHIVEEQLRNLNLREISLEVSKELEEKSEPGVSQLYHNGSDEAVFKPIDDALKASKNHACLQDAAETKSISSTDVADVVCSSPNNAKQDELSKENVLSDNNAYSLPTVLETAGKNDYSSSKNFEAVAKSNCILPEDTDIGIAHKDESFVVKENTEGTQDMNIFQEVSDFGSRCQEIPKVPKEEETEGSSNICPHVQDILPVKLKGDCVTKGKEGGDLLSESENEDEYFEASHVHNIIFEGSAGTTADLFAEGIPSPMTSDQVAVIQHQKVTVQMTDPSSELCKENGHSEKIDSGTVSKEKTVLDPRDSTLASMSSLQTDFSDDVEHKDNSISNHLEPDITQTVGWPVAICDEHVLSESFADTVTDNQTADVIQTQQVLEDQKEQSINKELSQSEDEDIRILTLHDNNSPFTTESAQLVPSPAIEVKGAQFSSVIDREQQIHSSLASNSSIIHEDVLQEMTVNDSECATISSVLEHHEILEIPVKSDDVKYQTDQMKECHNETASEMSQDSLNTHTKFQVLDLPFVSSSRDTSSSMSFSESLLNDEGKQKEQTSTEEMPQITTEVSTVDLPKNFFSDAAGAKVQQGVANLLNKTAFNISREQQEASERVAVVDVDNAVHPAHDVADEHNHHGESAIDVCNQHGELAVDVYNLHEESAVDVHNQYDKSAVDVHNQHEESAVDVHNHHGESAVDVCKQHGELAVDVYNHHGESAVDVCKQHGELAVEVYNQHEESAVDVHNQYEESAVDVHNQYEESAVDVHNQHEESAVEVYKQHEESANQLCQ
ncbi:uncharacterized protein LOC122788659 [Protopterus annectens]|uniref:uncharacterized protein LOC122788659 n=1 Tax=Protopterus annectens TaxID=7888 RepID=UPI001CFBD7D6|nr:uncharacterized protein LOC122788659 [Protopterus annectens]